MNWPPPQLAPPIVRPWDVERVGALTRWERVDSTGRPEFPQSALHGLAGDYVSAVHEATEAPVEFHVASFLGGSGMQFGRACYVSQGDQVYPNHFIASVAATATRKSTARRLYVKNIFDRMEQPMLSLVAGVGTGEGFLHKLAEAGVKTGHSDDDPGAPIESRGGRVLLEVDELTGLLAKGKQQRDGSTLMSTLLEAADAPAVQQLATRKRPLKIYDGLLGIIGSTTAQTFMRRLGTEAIENGFVNRWLYVTGAPAVRRPLPEPPDADVMSRIRGLLQQRIRIAQARGSRRVEFSNSAAELWTRWYLSLPVPDGGLDGHAIARTEKHAARVALTYALLDGAQFIEPHHVVIGIELALYSAAVIQWLLQDVAETKEAASEQRILAAIARRADPSTGWARKRDVQQATSGLGAAVFNRCVDNLARAGVISWGKDEENGAAMIRLVGPGAP